MGVPAETYHAIDACSSTRLKDMGRSPAYCRYMALNPKPPTAAMAVGSYVDALLLDPDAEDGLAVNNFDART